MQADLEPLIELQQVELRLRELTTQIRVFPRLREETEQELESARQTLQSAQDARTENAKQRKKLELDVQQAAEKIDKLKGQLLEVKTNDAYRALQDEVAYLEKQKAEAEDRELEAMVVADEFDVRIKEAEAGVKAAEQTISATLKRLDADQKAREEEAAGLEKQRAELRGQINEDSLDNYDRLAAGKNGRALAAIHDEICQGCMTQVRPQVFLEVRRREKIHTCGTCHRILYVVRTPTVDLKKEMARGDKA